MFAEDAFTDGIKHGFSIIDGNKIQRKINAANLFMRRRLLQVKSLKNNLKLLFFDESVFPLHSPFWLILISLYFNINGCIHEFLRCFCD
jgi:hypothetical protein